MKQIKRCFSQAKKVLILQGYESQSTNTQKIISQLKQIDPQLEFFGVKSETFDCEDFKHYGDLSYINDKMYEQFKNFHFLNIRNPLIIPGIFEQIMNFRLMKKMEKQGFFEYLNQIIKDDLLMTVSVGNQLLANKINDQIRQIMTKQQLPKPVSVHFGRSPRLFTYDFHDNFDYYISQLNHLPLNKDQYFFPGAFIGKKVVYDCYKYILENSRDLKNRIQDDKLLLNNQINHLELEESIFNLRQQFRKQHGFKEEDLIFFISPGSNIKEIKDNLKVSKKGIETFLNKHGYVNRKLENFGIVLSLPEDMEYQIDINEFKNFQNQGIQLIVQYGNKNGQRYQGMAASDFGACQNGDSVLECSTFQLLTVILDNKNILDSYRVLWYNVFDNDLNLVEDKQILPEMMGRNFGEKLSELWEEWYMDKGSRYRVGIQSNKMLLKCLPKISQQQELNIYENPDKVQYDFLKKTIQEAQQVLNIQENNDSIRDEFRMELLGRSFNQI